MSKTHTASSGGDIRGKTRRTIEAPSGFVYVVRGLPTWKFVAALRTIPDLMAALKAVGDGDTDAKIGAISRYLASEANAAPVFERLLTGGLVEPGVGTGEDQVEVADIPWNDQGVLVSAIMDLSGYNVAAAEALRPTSAGQGSSEPSMPSDGGTASAPQPSSDSSAMETMTEISSS